MKKILMTAIAGTILFASCSDSKKKEGDKKDESTSETTKMSDTDSKQAWVPVDSAMMDKAWKENMTVTENHKLLAKQDGAWEGEMTMWMADGAPPQKATTSTINKMIYNGLYQQANHSGTMMGAPFEGMSIMGYDNMKKEFFSTWVDNMGSGVLIMTGQLDPATKKISLSGKTTCMNGQEAPMREVFTMIDDNNQLLEMYGPDPATGKEYKNMEIKYSRKK